MELTPHFTFEELTNTSVSAKMLALNREKGLSLKSELFVLALFAEQVRAFLKVPMIITSGYRCKELNKAIGGSETSQHIKVEAIDFIPRKISIEEAYDLLSKSLLLYGQLIIEKSKEKKWIHISMGYKKQNLSYVDGIYQK